MDNIDAYKLSTYEREGLSTRFNLASAYPKQPLTAAQHELLDELPALFASTYNNEHLTAKYDFEQAFFNFAGQSSVTGYYEPLSQYSGSAAIELIANYLRLTNKTVTLIHPTFDAIADTLKRHRVPLFSITEEAALTLNETSPDIGTNALYLVLPNNPTGQYPTQQQFTDIVAYCKKYRILLIIDFCFRFYGDFWDYDQYQLMHDAGIDFITTEDTGKTWPTAELKVGMVICSAPLQAALQSISIDFLVGVSPFIFTLLSRFIALEQPGKRQLFAQDTIDTNRSLLQRALDKTALKVVYPDARIGVEWLQLPKGWDALHLTAWLHERGVQILPGDQFYWENNRQGQRYIRIALLKGAYFPQAVERLKELIGQYDPIGRPVQKL